MSFASFIRSIRNFINPPRPPARQMSGTEWVDSLKLDDAGAIHPFTSR